MSSVPDAGKSTKKGAARLQGQYHNAWRPEKRRGGFGTGVGGASTTATPNGPGSQQRGGGPTSMTRNPEDDKKKKVAAKATTEEVDASELLLSFAGGGAPSTPGGTAESNSSESSSSQQNQERSATVAKAKKGSKDSGGVGNNTAGSTTASSASADKFFSYALEFAAGVALRKHVLQPVLSALLPNNMPTDVLVKISQLLGSYSRGEEMYLKSIDPQNPVIKASVSRTNQIFSATIGSWWDFDKVLSYSSPEWSDWWVKRCHLVEPGCEMINLITSRGDMLGVAYFERNIVDLYDHQLKRDERVRVTLIRGIRLSPLLNPEVIRRLDLPDTAEFPKMAEFKGIASLLFCHILLTSIRYGTQCIGVHCPKNEVAEKFYESFMGKAFCRHEVDGRRYYRIDSKRRWEILRESFRRQMSLWEQFQRHQKAKIMLSSPHTINNHHAAGNATATNQLRHPGQHLNGNGHAVRDQRHASASKRKDNNTSMTREDIPTEKRKRIKQEPALGTIGYNGNGKGGATGTNRPYGAAGPI